MSLRHTITNLSRNREMQIGNLKERVEGNPPSQVGGARDS